MALAKSLMADGRDAVIINTDASQVYADIPIMSAAPTAEDMAQVPHALFGHVDGAENYNAARALIDARAALSAAITRGATAILTGGTGMYIGSLLDGIAPMPPIDPDIRATVRAMKVADAYAALSIEDPAAAARLNPADDSRVKRALEVIRSTDQSLILWQEQREGGIAPFVSIVPALLVPPRFVVRAKCEARLLEMVNYGAEDADESGGIAEVRRLIERELDPELPVMRAIGVPEIAAYLRGELTLDAALDQAQIATRQYAKRQFTWFRNQPPLDWPRHESQLTDEIIDDIVIKLREKLLTS